MSNYHGVGGFTPPPRHRLYAVHSGNVPTQVGLLHHHNYMSAPLLFLHIYIN